MLIATGFTAFDPSPKPYGYGKMPDVITTLEAERILKRQSVLKRPSNGMAPEKIAFIQCVGSRDHQLGHNWCSKICCGSALRMARLIQHRSPSVEVTIFYIDVQTFGRDFESFYAQSRSQIRMVRAIPGDIFPAENNRLRVAYFDPRKAEAAEALFDMVLLATAITPGDDNRLLAEMTGLPLGDTGFFLPQDAARGDRIQGFFTAGTALGPMSISESIASAQEAVAAVLAFLAQVRQPA